MAPCKLLTAATASVLALVAQPAVSFGLAMEGGSMQNTWAVIAAGSSGFFNYRHQADACHAYQVLIKRGIPAEQIILMMQDDVAGSSENPFPGKLYNKPGMDVPDVYDGCKIDYRGSVVTGELFMKVITGDASAGGKVLKSGANDRVFLNFVDHGGVGIIAFPNGPVLHASELSTALKKMESKKMFKELLFYMEACESGSMFPDLTENGKIFAVTAANAHESSWGFYCDSTDKVHGKSMGTCLGDLFSIAWMEDSDLGKTGTETIKAQVAAVTKRTTKSHVTQFGDKSFESEAVGNFEMASSLTTGRDTDASGQAMDARDIPMHMAYRRWSAAHTERERAAAWAKLQAVVKARAADEKLFRRMASAACKQGQPGCDEGMQGAKTPLADLKCHKVLVQAVHEHCPRRASTDTGGWNDFNMRFSQVLVNICEGRSELQMDTGALLELVKSECRVASAEAASIVDIVV